MIFRAIYYRRDPYLAANAEPEAYVFVEAYSVAEAGQKLAVILPALLGCPADEAQWYNLESEDDLRANSVSRSDGDRCDLERHLVECGFAAGAPVFLTHEQMPLLLLNSAGRLRVHKAMASAPTTASCTTARTLPATTSGD